MCVCTVCSVCVFVESMYKEKEKRYPLFTLVFNYVVCHLSSFGTGWSVVVQFGYWWYTWSHEVHFDY